MLEARRFRKTRLLFLGLVEKSTLVIRSHPMETVPTQPAFLNS